MDTCGVPFQCGILESRTFGKKKVLLESEVYYMKTRKIRLLSALLALAMLLALLPTAAFADNAPGGNCGKDGSDVKWSFDTTTGTLTISGTGKMKDYDIWNNDQPWYNQRDSIKHIVIENGVTNIGNGAFIASNAKDVVIPDSVTSIGDNAFAGSGITSIAIPASITTIGIDAFYMCSKLESADMSNATALKEIKAYAFAHCSALKKVELPQNGILETIGGCAFGCYLNNQLELAPKITEIRIPASVKVIENEAFLHCAKLQEVFFGANSQLTTVGDGAFGGVCPENRKFYTNDENVRRLLLEKGTEYIGGDILPLPQPTPEPDPEPETYPITIDYGTAYDADHNVITKAAKGETVYVEASETALDGMVFERWEVRKGEVKLENDRAAKTSFTMSDGMVQLEAMYQAADASDSGWDAATVVTGVAVGTGTAILAYHIGMEVYAEQVLGKDVAVPRTRGEVALLAWQLAGSPAVNVEGEPLSEAAQAERWAVESGLMEPDAEGNFNGTKKMSKWNALRTLDAAKKMG